MSCMDGIFPKYNTCWMRGDMEGHGWVRMDRFGRGSVHLCVGTRGNTEMPREKERMGSDGHTKQWKTRLQNGIQTLWN